MDPSTTHDALVSQFCGITGAAPAIAQTTLQATEWNFEDAIAIFYASQDADDDNEQDDDDDETQQPQPIPVSSTLPPAASSTSSRLRAAAQVPTSTMKTIHDLAGQHEGDGSDSESDHEQDFFAGGEKSGLAVQNPNRGGPSSDPFNDILNQARRNAERPEDDGPPRQEGARSSAFTGRAQTLGGDDAPSQIIEDENATDRSRDSLPRIERVLHLWQDGFSIDDGPLHRFDDPANASTLALINQGRAPLALLGVQPGQEVDLKLDTHKNENYVAPKKSYKPFGGSGQRLGSPTPGVAATAPPPPAAAAAPSASSSSAAPAAASPPVNIDPAAPVITLQIRLGDGSRLTSRFNTTHTVSSIYEFVDLANTANSSRPYALMTIMPNKDLLDKTIALGDIAELKRGGVVVQRWL